jgi:hypothetical protein
MRCNAGALAIHFDPYAHAPSARPSSMSIALCAARCGAWQGVPGLDRRRHRSPVGHAHSVKPGAAKRLSAGSAPQGASIDGPEMPCKPRKPLATEPACLRPCNPVRIVHSLSRALLLLTRADQSSMVRPVPECTAPTALSFSSFAAIDRLRPSSTQMHGT